jgi:type II secretory pathway component GspD/PulD (secretin)
LVGPLFRTQATHVVDTELVILITPTVVNPAPAPKQHEKASGVGTTPEVRASLRRLERELKHLRQEVDTLHREYRSRPAPASATAGGR